MRHAHKIARVSKTLAGPNRHLSNDRPTFLPNSSSSSTPSATALNSSQKSIPKDDRIFCDQLLIFDTHRMINFLRAGGFSQTQSETITDAMVRVSQHANRHHTTQMVTKNEFSSLRSELSILEKADFALLKTDINAIEKRMETSVAEIYTAVERVENRVIKWVIAVAGAIGLAILRLTTTSSGSSAAGSRIGAPLPPSNVATEEVPRVVKKKGLQILVT